MQLFQIICTCSIIRHGDHKWCACCICLRGPPPYATICYQTLPSLLVLCRLLSYNTPPRHLASAPPEPTSPNPLCVSTMLETGKNLTQKQLPQLPPITRLEGRREKMGDFEILLVLQILPRLHLGNPRHIPFPIGRRSLMSWVGRVEVATFTFTPPSPSSRSLSTSILDDGCQQNLKC